MMKSKIINIDNTYRANKIHNKENHQIDGNIIQKKIDFNILFNLVKSKSAEDF